MLEVLRDAPPLAELSGSYTKRHEKPDVESKNDTDTRGSQTKNVAQSNFIVSSKPWGISAFDDAGLS